MRDEPMRDDSCEQCELPKYIGVKTVWAEPMTRDAFEKKHDRNVGGSKYGDGYEVTYEGGYQAWSPKDVFDEAYRPISSGVTQKMAWNAIASILNPECEQGDCA